MESITEARQTLLADWQYRRGVDRSRAADDWWLLSPGNLRRLADIANSNSYSSRGNPRWIYRERIEEIATEARLVLEERSYQMDGPHWLDLGGCTVFDDVTEGLDGHPVVNIWRGWNWERVRVSHLAWELACLERPKEKGLCVLHKCDVRPCWRFDHLFLGTRSDNTRDMLRKNRSGIAKLSPEVIAVIRSGDHSDKELACQLGVTIPTIRHARLGKTWGYL